MRAALALAALLTACGEDELVLSYFGSDAGYVQAQDAAEEWRNVCGEHIQVTRAPWHTPLVEVDMVHGDNGEPAEGKSGGTAQQDGKVLSVQFRKGPGAPRDIRHELGHALGREHAEAGIMARIGPEDQRVTPDDC